MNRHRQFEQMLAARGMLTPDEREHLVTHLAGCLSCRQRAEAYDRQDRYLQTLRLDVPSRSALPAVLAAPAPATPKPWGYRLLPALLGHNRAGLPGRMVGFAVLALLALAIVTGAVYAAGSIIHVYHPEERPSPGNLSRLFYAPALPPYPTVHYRSLDPRRATQESGYAVAYSRTPPRDISAAVGVDIVPHVGWPKHPSGPQPTDRTLSGLAVAIRSVVRYRGSGHTVIVLLNEPSPTAIKTRELWLGEHTVHLPYGQEAWASPDQLGALPFIHPRPSTAPSMHPGLGTVNMLAWVEGHYVVSLWSDLSEARLRQLAATTAVVPPNPTPSQRGIPSTWPTPLPLDRLPARLQAVVSGGATYQRHGTTLTVAYLFNFTSYSQGALYGLDQWHNISVTIVFPSALQQRSTEPIRHQTIPGGEFGTGGDITFKVAGMAPATLARALRQGGMIRLAWTEHQQRRRQTFYFPLTSGSCEQVRMGCPKPATGR
jgi:hypothetical protein